MRWSFFFRSLKYTLIQLHSVSGILGYKINFDSNGDAEFNLTLLDMQPIGKLMLILAFPERLEGYSRDQGFAQKTALDSGNVNGIRDLTDLTFTGEAAPIANKVCDWKVRWIFFFSKFEIHVNSVTFGFRHTWLQN